jgi:acetyl esterase/lipase
MSRICAGMHRRTSIIPKIHINITYSKESMMKFLQQPLNLAALLLTCLLAAGGCQSSATTESAEKDIIMDSSEVKRIVVIDDIPYRSGPSEAWRLDLAMPENFGGGRHPAIVIIHGGGWRAGSKQDRPYRSMLVDYALKGYVTMSVNYRFINEAPMPACIEDVKCAVRWLRAHADKYHVDPDRIGTYGHSAGAHLAMMLALCPESPEMEGDGGWNEYSSSVTSAAGGSTPTVLPDRFGDSEKYSPASYISADVPPLLLIHGTEDNIVSVESADEFVKKLKEAGATDVTYIRIDGGNHGVAYEDNRDSSEAAMDKFFKRTLKK